jgi:hypothetical protein
MTSKASTPIVVTQTTTIGPNVRRRHGPRSASVEIAAEKSATEATTLTMGIEKRHHGRRLARKVDTGTVAATVVNARVLMRS